jgi:hypothetical protein
LAKPRYPRKTREERAKDNAPYKSKYEKTVAKWLEDNNVPFDYEGKTLPYEAPMRGSCPNCGCTGVTRTRHYVPDFWVYPNGKLNPVGAFVLETKGRFTSEDRTKMKAIVEQYPGVKVRMLFMRDNKLNKKSAVYYSHWAKKFGIEHSVGTFLPESWIKKTKKGKKQ